MLLEGRQLPGQGQAQVQSQEKGVVSLVVGQDVQAVGQLEQAAAILRGKSFTRVWAASRRWRTSWSMGTEGT